MSMSGIARCADGTEIEFAWAYDGAEQFPWLLNAAHYPEPFTPMEVWLYGAGEPGSDRAWIEAALEPIAQYYRFQLAGPFQYVRRAPWEDEREGLVARASDALLARYGSVAAFWRAFSEPRIRAAVDYFREPQAEKSMLMVAERWAHGWWQTFTPMTPMLLAQAELLQLLSEHFDEGEATLLLDEVRQGGENASQDIDAEIDVLAAIARDDDTVAELILEAGEDLLDRLRGEPSALKFAEAFDALILKHADRSFRWDIEAPTWGEKPELVLGIVSAQIKSPRNHAASRVSSLVRRDSARERVLAALPAEKNEEFQRLLHVFEDYVAVREGRAYWQMMLTGATRTHLLRRGAQLVAEGYLATAEDVLYVLPNEFEGSVVEDLADRALTRRTEWERLRQVSPPTLIGQAPADAPAPTVAVGRELRGLAASRGTVTGRARIVRDPEESAYLEDGEILVCTMTTPAWTPIFAFAAGVVTETGTPISHPAIVAREYGIPCVVGVAGATKRIAEGALVTVDGTTGIVRIEG